MRHVVGEGLAFAASAGAPYGMSGSGPALAHLRGLRWLWVALLLPSLLVGMAPVAAAQEAESWSSPVWLSQTVVDGSGAPARSTMPVLVADAWGLVHAFWSVALDGSATAVGDTLFYSRWDGAVWSAPVDIIVTAGRGIAWPQAAADDQGWLHLTWTGGGTAWYSRARAEDARSPGAWEAPTEVSTEFASNASLAVDDLGAVHIVYCSNQELGYVAHTSSPDGRRWSLPVHMARVEGCFPRIAVGEQARLHVVFSDQPGVGTGSAVFYVRSDDQGTTWSPLRQVDAVDDRFTGDYGPSWPNVVTGSDNVVHLVWDGSPAGQRWHQVSADAGDTWSAPQQLDAYHRGLTGPNALGFDSAGVLHMVSMGWVDSPERVSGAFHTVWRNGRWWPLVQIGQRTDWDAEGPSLAIAGGNLLYAAWWNRSGETLQVWTSHVQLDAPAVEPRPWPTARPEPTIGPAARATSAPSPSPGPSSSPIPSIPRIPAPAPGRGSEGGWGLPLLTGLLPVLVLVGLVFVVEWRRRLR